MSDLDDYLAYLRYERAAAAQTITTYRRLLLQFAAAFPEENLRALDAQTLRDYLLVLTKERGYSAATLNQHRAALRGYYGWLHRQRGLADDPSTHLKLPRKSKRPLPEVLTPEQTTALLTPPEDSDPLKLRDHAILELFYSAGLRLAELAALNADLPEANGHTIVRGKGGVERLVFIGSKAREALARWRVVRGSLQKKTARNRALSQQKRHPHQRTRHCPTPQSLRLRQNPHQHPPTHPAPHLRHPHPAILRRHPRRTGNARA